MASWLHLKTSLRARLDDHQSWRTLRAYLPADLYRFSFRYFCHWERLQWHRCIHWQRTTSPESDQLALVRPSLDEYLCLRDILPRHPSVVLDLGCGTGRSSVFFRHMMPWPQTHFVLADGHAPIYGGITTSKENMIESQHSFLTELPSNGETFYTNLDLVDRFLLSNHMQHYSIVDLALHNGRLGQTSRYRGQIDLLYSFSAVGYHWDLVSAFDHYGLHHALAPGAMLVFGIRPLSDPKRAGLRLDEFCQRGYRILQEIPGTIPFPPTGLTRPYLILEKR